MEKTFVISVRGKQAKNLSAFPYICHNSDYSVRFEFDDDWDKYPIKTARFVSASGQHQDVVVDGSTCEFPLFTDTTHVEVGVFAGDLSTTTAALVPARRSILSGTGSTPAVPPDDAYNKMMEVINADALRAETAANDAQAALEGMQERYYIPAVDGAGELSWQGNAEGMPVLPTVNIKGPKGNPGYTPVKGTDYFDGKDGYTPVKGKDYFDGKDGVDAISPIVDVKRIEGGHRVTITDADGEKTFDVMDGEDGGSAVPDEEVLALLGENDLMMAVHDGEGVLCDENKTVIEW